MSQTFFSKLDHLEKDNRLSALGNSHGRLTVWQKGKKAKHVFVAVSYDKTSKILALDTREDIFPNNSLTLVNFESRGMNFFSEAIFIKSAGDFACLKFDSFLYKAEKRASYRLMTFPQHEIWAEFKLNEAYDGGKIIDFKTRQSTTQIFNKFLTLVEGDAANPSALKIRVQDLSTTGLALHIGELESKYFPKDAIYKNVRIKFEDEEIIIPEVKIVYTVNYIGTDKNLKKFKVGVHFENISNSMDLWLGRKITTLLRDNDQSKDFENLKK